MKHALGEIFLSGPEKTFLGGNWPLGPPWGGQGPPREQPGDENQPIEQPGPENQPIVSIIKGQFSSGFINHCIQSK